MCMDTASWALEDITTIDVLANALKHIADEYLPAMDHRELGERCSRLDQLRRQLDGIISINIAEASRAGVPANAGQRTMAQYLSARNHASPDARRADHRVGVWVSGYELLEASMLLGQLSRRHVDHLRRMENIRVATAMQRDQHLFVEWATDLEWRSFTQACTYWLLVNDQDGPEPEDHNTNNTLTTSTRPDGRITVSGNLDPITGAILIEQLGRETTALFNEDQEHNYPRPVAERRAQALANLIQRGANRNTTSAKPLVHVVMSLNVLQHAIAQMALDPAEQDFTSVLDPNDIDGRCELIDGTPIHPKYALVLLMQARIRRQVLGAKNETLDASIETRLFPDWMKHTRLIETRGQCVTAGCDANHTWLHADHRQPASHNGPTTLANLDPLCAPDNKHKNTGPPMRQRTHEH